MTVVSRSSHALVLNGVSDGIIVPQASFSSTDLQLPEGKSSIPATGESAHGIQTVERGTNRMDTFCVEAWVRPDCGGIVASQEGVFELKVGQVGEPGPAVFTIHLQSDAGQQTVSLSTAEEDTTTPRWSGVTFPRHGLDLHGSYNSHSGNTKATAMNMNHRELLHIVAFQRFQKVGLFINGSLAAQQILSDGEYRTVDSSADMYIGGKGGQYRGAIESLHLTSDFYAQNLMPQPPVPNDATYALWRFEEPAHVHPTIYRSGTLSSAGGMVKTITLSTSDAQSLIATTTGNAYDAASTYNSGVAGKVDLSASPYSHGDYKVVDYVSTPGSPTTMTVPHTPYNILFNADAVNHSTKKPNQKPPERLRLIDINGATGVITVESIHLDFVVVGGPRRGVLHDRTTNVDDHFVLLSGDLLLDSGTGKPYQPPHYGSQAIDRTGQMVIDEGGEHRHGLIYSTRMSTTTTDPNNPFAVVWPASLDTGFQMGHTGRHTLSVTEGHHFMRQFPKANEEIVHQTIDGTADVVEIHFDSSQKRLRDLVAPNSRVDIYRETVNAKVLSVLNEGWAFQMVSNGKAAGNGREILAIGGIGAKDDTSTTEFDYAPFALRSPVHRAQGLNDANYRIHHLRPIETSRIAVLSVPSLADTAVVGAGNELAPFIQVHYKAIDVTGASMGLTKPCLLVEKTVPSADLVLGATNVYDVVAADLADAAKDTRLFSPGGLLRLDTQDSSGHLPETNIEQLFASSADEGIDYEDILDESLTPQNYTPSHTSDPANEMPKAVAASHAPNNQKDANFHRMVVDYTNPDLINQVAKTDNYHRTTPSIINTGAGVYDIGNTSQSSHVYEAFDIIEIHKAQGSVHGVLEAVIHPSDRSRTTQLVKFNTSTTRPDEPNTISLQMFLSRARAVGFSNTEGNERHFALSCIGLMGDVAARTIDVLGSGAPDSHIVKEIMPGAPVVTVSLGGVGQGAVNTKPTYDPSPFTRLGWNTRRDCAVQVNDVGFPTAPTTPITVIPLNNETEDLASWGTYCFPKAGRVYLENGAHALYESKTGTQFNFSGVSVIGSRKFINADGSEAPDIGAWTGANDVVSGTLFFVDGDFGEDSVCNDGSSINDRMFQRMDTVSHDYQLGTQYASTRSLVEIPLFPDLFFENRERCITPGPDNSLKLHVDATHTAHAWAPNPVGRRCPDISPTDRTIFSAYSNPKNKGTLRKGTHTAGLIAISGTDIQIPIEETDLFNTSTTAPTTFGGFPLANRYLRAFLENGEWVAYSSISGGNLVVSAELQPTAFSKNFRDTYQVGMAIYPGPGLFTESLSPLRNHPHIVSAGYESRRPYYYDRANVQTQGGSLDYGLRQYVSAIELRAGPRENPHLAKTKTKRASSNVLSWTAVGNKLVLEDGSEFPLGGATQNYQIAGASQFMFRICFTNLAGNEVCAHYEALTGNTMVLSNLGATFDADLTAALAAGSVEMRVKDFHNITAAAYPRTIDTVALNRAWNHPYAAGGLRNGDTVWMNMHYTNPHAIEGLFCKSRGVFNEAQVSTHFTGGQGRFALNPRDSIPMENFLIGDDCLETARHLVQHINKTIELNWEVMNKVDTPEQAPIVAFLDPYQSTEEFSRILLYDVAHDREFIAMHDIHMQVQSSPATPEIGLEPSIESPPNTPFDGFPTFVNYSTELDVANGFPSELKNLAPTAFSEYIEAAHAHNLSTGLGGLYPVLQLAQTPQKNGGADGLSFPRVSEGTCNVLAANKVHKEMQSGEFVDEMSTLLDTPEGTRAIPAFLCLKGIRDKNLDLSNHPESRLKNLPQWTQMDFVRRLTVDLGEVGLRIGKTDIEAAALEVVRLINQAGAPKGRTHARRPADQYPGESERLDLSNIGPNPDASHSNLDASAPHLAADFSVTGSTHDPAPFWDTEKAFASHDRGSHMGYVRAHIGRVVEDSEGNEGWSVVIHSTIPGASGRNFCVWLDNSRGQSAYRPQFLVGHGGRFRNFWCRPDDVLSENMHPAPMPINKDGRPFAPITTLKEYLPPDDPNDEFFNNANYGQNQANLQIQNANQNSATGRNANTVYNESYESQSPDSVLVEGLRPGTQARARINFGGMVASGIPGFSPRAGKWGMGREGNSHYTQIYGQALTVSEVTYTKNDPVVVSSGHVPEDEVAEDAIGDSQLYGIRLTDHIGRTHTIRFIYSQVDAPFTNERTVLPPTIDQEIVVWIDDRDVGQGGFTLGRHMWGANEDVTGHLTGGVGGVDHWVGNTWQPYPAPDIGISLDHTNVSYTGSTLTIEFLPPYDTGPATHSDLLGYLGFTESGLFQYHDGGSGVHGQTFSYTGRSHFDVTGDPLNPGKHYFFGCEGPSAIFGAGTDHVISPRVNWTTLVTDELMAAIVEFAINMDDPNQQKLRETRFDCRHMYAADGRTFGDWGIKKDSIRIKAYSKTHEVIPLRCLFEVTREKDWGISASNVLSEIGQSGVDTGKRFATGYLPETVLHINTRYRGSNANTATPVLVDTMNNVVDTRIWRDNLRGTRYVGTPGDLIIPAISNPTVVIDAVAGIIIPGNTIRPVLGVHEIWHFARPASTLEASSWGERRKIWLDEQDWGMVQAHNSIITHQLFWPTDNTKAVSKEFESRLLAAAASGQPNIILSAYADPEEVKLFDGLRLKGNEFGEPFVYFRGGRDSSDHSVPIYFGGGFSGVVLDVNDGTQNDYSDFYTHPYSKGPTGSAGLQNIGEKSTAYCLLDCTAILAMFPGTPYLDNHKGATNSPYFNQDAILSPDLDAGANTAAPLTGLTYTVGTQTVNTTKPSPVILRFAHSRARYNSEGDGAKTTYIIFGPGQAFPFNSQTEEPNGQDIIALGNLWSSVPLNSYLPNEISNGDGISRSGTNSYLPAGANYQGGNVIGWNYTDNWDVAHGKPNVISQDNTGTGGSIFGYDQSADDGLFLDPHHSIGGPNRIPPPYSHAFQHVPPIAASAVREAGYLWHMDGGYHPGGHFLDNHVLKNPPNPIDNQRIAHGVPGKKHPASFRVSGLLASAYGALDSIDSEDYIIVDATRVQNSEELGAVLSCAINEFPGRDALKALGGTFLPSFQNASKQDRYGWVPTVFQSYDAVANTLTAANPLGAVPTMPPIPQYGWVRTEAGGNGRPGIPIVGDYPGGGTATFAPYESVDSTTIPGSLIFNLAPNHGGIGNVLADAVTDNPITAADPGTVNAAASKVFIWTKSSTQIFNNGRVTGSPASVPKSQDYMCHVHFNGLTDALDRTRPIGAVGWHGERYSRFNSLQLKNPDEVLPHDTFASGLGAWHSFLGFSPYGPSTTCQSFSIPAAIEGAAVVYEKGCPQGLAPRHLVAVTYESESALAAKADRNGTLSTGDWMGAVQGHALESRMPCLRIKD